MKKTIICIILTMVLAAGNTNANTIQSSTMWFQGTLTYDGIGYTGVLNMVDEASLGIGDGVSGFDIYAKEGATAWFGDAGSSPVWTSQAIGADHDAWPSWNPDTPDWYQYSIEFKSDGTWYLRNHAGATASTPQSTIPQGVPMSGVVNWTTGIATETDTGAYMTSATSEIPGGAASQAASQGMSTAGAWDMDWSWGSELVPLEYPYFQINFVTSEAGVNYVTLTPVPIPGAVLLGLFGLSIAGIKLRKFS